jgi:UDP-N-acetylglucosamine 2-epimerase
MSRAHNPTAVGKRASASPAHWRSEAGAGSEVKPGADRIVRETALLLENREEFERMSRAHNPYGDGHASERVADALARLAKVRLDSWPNVD